MADMRLFHHFLITAYPHLPVGADKIWITAIPGFAHNVCVFHQSPEDMKEASLAIRDREKGC